MRYERLCRGREFAVRHELVLSLAAHKLPTVVGSLTSPFVNIQDDIA